MALNQNKLAGDLKDLANNAAVNHWALDKVQEQLAKVIFDFVSAATVSGVTVTLADESTVRQTGSVNVT